jgi:hypothetical protein
MLVFFSITTALVKVDSDSWQTAFFVVTMILIVLLNGGYFIVMILSVHIFIFLGTIR